MFNLTLVISHELEQWRRERGSNIFKKNSLHANNV